MIVLTRGLKPTHLDFVLDKILLLIILQSNAIDVCVANAFHCTLNEWEEERSGEIQSVRTEMLAENQPKYIFSSLRSSLVWAVSWADLAWCAYTRVHGNDSTRTETDKSCTEKMALGQVLIRSVGHPSLPCNHPYILLGVLYPPSYVDNVP